MRGLRIRESNKLSRIVTLCLVLTSPIISMCVNGSWDGAWGGDSDSTGYIRDAFKLLGYQCLC